MNNRQLQAKTTKEDIMRIAKELIQEYSYDGLSIDLMIEVYKTQIT